MKLIYSAEAVQDLVRLRQFIAEKNPAAATRIATVPLPEAVGPSIAITGDRLLATFMGFN